METNVANERIRYRDSGNVEIKNGKSRNAKELNSKEHLAKSGIPRTWKESSIFRGSRIVENENAENVNALFRISNSGERLAR